MKRVEITLPKDFEDQAKEVLEDYSDDITTSKVEKDDRAFLQLEVSLESTDIDEITEALKDISDLKSGDLTIEVLEETARIEKGRRREGGSGMLSVQEMYEKAFEFASFGSGQWALIALGAGIAVFGAVMENVMVVVGSMVITPMLGPFIAASFGLVIGDKRLIRDSIFYGTLSILLAISSAFLIALVIPKSVNPLISLIADPGFATIPLSLFVGAAAALTFTTEMREALAGVAVAIALVPPAAVVGISLAMLNASLFLDVSLVLITNISSLVLAGSITFKLLDITPSTYYRKKVSEEKLKEALIISIASILLIGTIVGGLSYQDLRKSYQKERVNEAITDLFGDRVLTRTVEIRNGELYVRIAVISPDMTTEELERRLSRLVPREVNVKLLALQGTLDP